MLTGCARVLTGGGGKGGAIRQGCRHGEEGEEVASHRKPMRMCASVPTVVFLGNPSPDQ